MVWRAAWYPLMLCPAERAGQQPARQGWAWVGDRHGKAARPWVGGHGFGARPARRGDRSAVVLTHCFPNHLPPIAPCHPRAGEQGPWAWCQ